MQERMRREKWEGSARCEYWSKTRVCDSC